MRARDRQRVMLEESEKRTFTGFGHTRPRSHSHTAEEYTVLFVARECSV